MDVAHTENKKCRQNFSWKPDLKEMGCDVVDWI
jgi:hypothetical protein